MNKLLIQNGLVYNAIDREPKKLDILVTDGKISKLEQDIEVNEDMKVIDAKGLRVYPGFVEAHCHVGLDSYAEGPGTSDYNESTDPVTPQLRAIDGINPMSKAFELGREGGVTTICTGPGSANVIGGTFTAIKTAGKRIDDMIVKEEVAMKVAFGENPRRVYHENKIRSRMTTAALLRETLATAKEYHDKLELGRADASKLPTYNIKMEAMQPVINGEIPLKAHAHRADDIYTAIRIAKEFNVRLTLEHVTDGSLIAEDLAKEGYPCAVGPSLGHPGKLELSNKSFATPGDLDRAGCQVSIITDAGVVPLQNLALSAGLAVREGMDEWAALQAITINAAKHIGIEDRVGSIEVGKDGDFVVAKDNPMRSDVRVLMTIINGEIQYQYIQ